MGYLREHPDEQRFLALVSDQSPNPKSHYVMRWLNQDTAVVKGMERIARKEDCKVYYSTIMRTGRGRYEARLRLLADHVGDMEEGQLTASFFHALEEDIRREPTLFLWSHNRWKLTHRNKLSGQRI